MENNKEEFDETTKEPFEGKVTAIASTPIFDIVYGSEIQKGFRPVLLKSRNWVTMIVRYNDEFVMVKQLRYGLMKEQLEFPCGVIEDNEEPIDAGIRELREETGIELLDKTQIKYIGKFAANPAFMNNYMYYFYVDLTTAQFVQVDKSLDEHEKVETVFTPIKEAMSFVGTDKCASVFMGMALVSALTQM